MWLPAWMSMQKRVWGDGLGGHRARILEGCGRGSWRRSWRVLSKGFGRSCARVLEGLWRGSWKVLSDTGGRPNTPQRRWHQSIWPKMAQPQHFHAHLPHRQRRHRRRHCRHQLRQHRAMRLHRHRHRHRQRRHLHHRHRPAIIAINIFISRTLFISLDMGSMRLRLRYLIKLSCPWL